MTGYKQLPAKWTENVLPTELRSGYIIKLAYDWDNDYIFLLCRFLPSSEMIMITFINTKLGTVEKFEAWQNCPFTVLTESIKLCLTPENGADE